MSSSINHRQAAMAPGLSIPSGVLGNTASSHLKPDARQPNQKPFTNFKHATKSSGPPHPWKFVSNKASSHLKANESQTIQSQANETGNKRKRKNKKNKISDNERPPKKRSYNDKRSFLGQWKRNKEKMEDIGEQRTILHSSPEYPLIFQDKYGAAVDFAHSVHTSDTLWVLYTDGSMNSGPDRRPEGEPFSSSSLSSSPSDVISLSPCGTDSTVPSLSSSVSSLPPSCPSSSGTGSKLCSPSSLSLSSVPSAQRYYGGASVVYEDPLQPEGWKYIQFSLPGARGSTVAELHAIDQALKLALDEAEMDPPSKRRIVILTDSQGALGLIADHLTNTVKANRRSEPAAAASGKARRLRNVGIQLELRWIPGHMGAVGSTGNGFADVMAGKARNYTADLPEGLARKYDGQAIQVDTLRRS